MKQKNPFEIEKLRGKLAEKKQYKKLVKTYTKDYSEIKDFNTPKLWDSLNTKNSGEKNPMDQHRINIVEKLITGNNISVINLGFGSASLEKKYFEKHSTKNFQWRGIDISPESVKKAKKDFPKGSFEVGNIANVKSSSNSFDYAIALEVLEHIRPSQTFKALKEVFRIIKPGKYFLASVPLNEGLEEMAVRGENPNAHVRTYTPELIRAELEIAGFKILKERTLFAFHNYYRLKTVVANFFPNKFHKNNIILVAQKPLNNT